MNHLAMAKVLVKSIKKNMPGSQVIVCLVEKVLPNTDLELDLFDEIVLAKDLGFFNFERTIFKYSQYETAGACKGQLFKYIFKKYANEDQVIYLDADTQVFGPFSEVENSLLSHSIIVTPHLIQPVQDFTYFFGEMALLNSGIFNTGFIGLKRSEEAMEFLDWWCDRLDYYCYTDPVRGLYNEQKWLDLAPVFFEKVFNLRHPGYNVAYWNIFERNISKTTGNYLVNNTPLRFFHYSGLPYIQDTLYLINNETSVHGFCLIDEYITLLEEEGHNELSKIKWSYNYFDNETPISSKIRDIYKHNSLAQSELINPFSESLYTFRRYKR
jgi:hypothetical protein